MTDKISTKHKILYCLIANFILLLFLVIIINVLKTHSDYFRLGVPNENSSPLIVLSIKIDNYLKYYLLLFILGIINISKVIIDSIGNPILDWNIYNPDKYTVTDFTKNELLIGSNLFYLFSNLRSIFTILIAITQIDIALFSVLMQQIATYFTIKWLLNEKHFSEYKSIDEKNEIANLLL